jgi:hypothetical protein
MRSAAAGLDGGGRGARPAAGLGLIVGESLMGLLIAALIGFSGKDAPLALVGEGFAPAMWLGLAYFVGLCVFFYRRVLRK